MILTGVKCRFGTCTGPRKSTPTSKIPLAEAPSTRSKEKLSYRPSEIVTRLLIRVEPRTCEGPSANYRSTQLFSWRKLDFSKISMLSSTPRGGQFSRAPPFTKTSRISARNHFKTADPCTRALRQWLALLALLRNVEVLIQVEDPPRSYRSH